MYEKSNIGKDNFFTQHVDKRSALFETFSARYNALEKVYRDNINYLKKPSYKKNKTDLTLSKPKKGKHEDDKDEVPVLPVLPTFKGSRGKGSKKDFDFLNRKYKKDVANLTAELKRAEVQLRDKNYVPSLPKEEVFLYDIDHKDLLKILKDVNPVERFLVFNKKSNFVDDEDEAIAFLSNPLKVKKYLGFVKNRKNNRMTHYRNIKEQNLVETDLETVDYDNSFIDTTDLVGKQLRLAEKQNAKFDFVETVSNKKKFRRSVFRPVPMHGEESAKINLARWRQHMKEQAARRFAMREKTRRADARHKFREFTHVMFETHSPAAAKRVLLGAIESYVDVNELPLDPPLLVRQHAVIVEPPVVREKVIVPDVIKELATMNKFQKRRAEVEEKKQNSNKKPALTPDEIYRMNEKFNYIQQEKKASMVPFVNSKGKIFNVKAEKYDRMLETSRSRLLKKAGKLVADFQIEIKSESAEEQKEIRSESLEDFFTTIAYETTFGASTIFSKLLGVVLEPLVTLRNTCGPEIAGAVTNAIAVTCLAFQVSRARATIDIMAALTQYLTAYGISPAMHGIANLMESISKLASSHRIVSEADVEIPLASRAPSKAADILDHIREFGTKVFTSDFATNIKMLALTVIAGKWFPKDIAQYLKMIVGVPTKMTLVEMAGSIMEAISMLVRISEAWLRGVPINKLLFAGDPVALFLSETEKLMQFRERLYTGLPRAGAMCQKEFRTSVGKLIESGNALYKTINTFDPRKNQVKYVLVTLNTAAYNVDEYMKTHNRMPPLAIVLHGPPSIGKSHLVRWLCEIWSRVKGRKFDESHMYNRSRTSEYWEGYNPISHPIIHCSELGNMSVNMAKMQIDETLIELNSLIDGLPFNCDMAFDGKGKVYACPEFVIIDTNNIDMHIREQMFCPSAMFRRFLFLDVSVIGEFREENCTSLDKSISFAAGGNLLDRYYFDAFTYGANEKVAVRKDKFGHARIEEASVKLSDIFEKFLSINDQVSEKINYDFVSNLIPLGVNKDDIELKGEEEKDGCVAFEHAPSVDGDFLFVPSPLPPMKERIAGFIRRVGSKFVKRHIHFNNENMEMIPELPAVIRSEGFLENLPKLECVPLLVKLPEICQTAFSWLLLTSLLAYRNDGIARIIITVLAISLLYGFSQLAPLWLFLVSYCIWTVAPQQKKDNILMRFVKDRVYRFTMRRALNARDEYWQKLKHAVQMTVPCGAVPDPKEYRNPFNWREVTMVTACIATATIALKSFLKKDQKSLLSQGNISSFQQPSAANVDLIAMEHKMGVQRDEVYVRTSKPETPQWNVVEKMSRQSTYNGTPGSLFKTIGRNLRFTRVVGATTLRTFTLGVRGTFALINKHVFMGGQEVLLEVYQQLEFREGAQFTTVKLCKKDCVDVGNDVVAFDTVTLHFRDIVGHFCDGVVNACVGYINGHEVRAKRGTKTLIISDPYCDFHIDNYYEYHTEHKAGMCGTPLIGVVDRNGCAIIGIHCSGAAKFSDAYSSVIDRKTLEAGLNSLYTPYLKVNSESCSGTMETVMPSPKSPFRYMYTGHVNYRGRDPDTVVLINKWSKLELSPCAKDLDLIFQDGLSFQPSVRYSKPMMKPVTVNNVYISPYNIGLDKMNRPSPTFDPVIAQRVIDAMTNHIISGLSERGVNKLSPLGLLEAINGVEGDPFTRRINASTSGAYGYPGRKSKYIPLNEGTEIREPDSDLKHRLSHILSSYADEKSVMPIYSVQLKDEPREISKCETGKTRLFYMSPLDHLIISRQMLSPFYTLMVEHSDVFGAAVGINMHIGSDKMAKTLQSFATKFLEGDYGGFDLRCPTFIVRIVNTVVYNVLKHCGYKEVALKLVQGILSDNTFVNILMNGDVFSKPGLQPSGKYATAEDNSLRGLAMLLCAWFSNPNLCSLDFFEYCKPYLYGDDVLVGVKDDVIEEFNNIRYAAFAENVLGMEFTNSQKTGELEKYLHFENTSFLKRNFVWSERWSRFIAPLDLNSIYKSLQWTMPSDFIPRDEQCKATMTSALWELFFHCKSEYTFNYFKKHFESLLLEHYHMDPLEASLPGFWKIASALGFTEEPLPVDMLPTVDLDESLQDGFNYKVGQEL
jgi:hypothetical protein